VKIKPFFEIPYYHDYISPKLAKKLLEEARLVNGVDGLVEVGTGGGLETQDALTFLCDVYNEVKDELKIVLNQRVLDRKFIDERTKALTQYNLEYKNSFFNAEYETVIGLEDDKGRVVVGPLNAQYNKVQNAKLVAPIPDYFNDFHVTLFGPPHSAKIAINAMNAYHRKLKDEPAIIAELLATHKSVPKWGADDEDSKTPLRADLIDAAVNLKQCFDHTLSLEDKGKIYKLADDHLSYPIKRFPGLALPATFLFYKKNPIPLHIYDFVLHMYHNWQNKKALAFYVPKLENEEEARYIRNMIFLTETKLKKIFPEYEIGSVRLMIVLENPRAILRTNEIMDELYPYFMGASLGWHDYLGSTARLFKEDCNYRIPVKADPNIVIKYIKLSHNLLANVVTPRGGIAVGGMYGILPNTPELMTDSFQVTIKGFIKDIIVQLKRGLTGFWVAHPDFVRIGLAIVEAWKFYKDGKEDKLQSLIKALLTEKYHDEVWTFIKGEDIKSLDLSDPMYVRSLLVLTGCHI
jgi:malate synthase